MASTVEWVDNPVNVWMPKYEGWINRIIQAVDSAMSAREDEIQSWLKENHIWQNRTTLAETELFAKVIHDGLVITIVMGQGTDVYYSRFLERFMQPVGGGRGRFSVLGPALDYWGPVLLNEVKALLS